MATKPLTDEQFKARFAEAVARLRQAAVDLVEVSQPGIAIHVYLGAVSTLALAVGQFHDDMEELGANTIAD